MAMRLDFGELERQALELLFEQHGEARFRARQIFRWIYKQGVTNIEHAQILEGVNEGEQILLVEPDKAQKRS